MLISLDRARDQLAREGLDAVIATTPINVAYAGDFASEFLLGRFDDDTAAVILPADPDVPPALVVAEFDLPYLTAQPSWIDAVQLYGNPWSSVGVFMGETLERELTTPLRRRLATLRDRLKPTQQDDYDSAIVRALADRGLGAARLACDDLRKAARLEARGIGGNRGIVDGHQLMRRIRMVKSPDELAIMTRGATINAGALRAVIDHGSAGQAEDAVIRAYRRYLTEHDARWLGERGMMFGAGDASSFSLPASGERRLDPGDAVVLDCLGTFQGYYMDLARTAVVGGPTTEQERRHRAVLTALEAVEDAIRPGVHTQDLRRLTRDTIAGFGLRGELVSVTTHGIGLEVFEFPHADSLVNGFVLEEGMVVNTEVFYRDPELGSFHLEDSVAVTGGGCRFLAPMPRDLVVFQ